MNIARFKADIDGLSQHLQEASLARLYRDYHRATATMLEASQWRVGGRWWDRLVARRLELRQQITASTRTRPRPDLGGPATVAELRARGDVQPPAAQPARDPDRPRRVPTVVLAVSAAAGRALGRALGSDRFRISCGENSKSV